MFFGLLFLLRDIIFGFYDACCIIWIVFCDFEIVISKSRFPESSWRRLKTNKRRKKKQFQMLRTSLLRRLGLLRIMSGKTWATQDHSFLEIEKNFGNGGFQGWLGSIIPVLRDWINYAENRLSTERLTQANCELAPAPWVVWARQLVFGVMTNPVNAHYLCNVVFYVCEFGESW